MTDDLHLHFRVPFEEPPPTIDQLLERAWPEGIEEARTSAIDRGCVEVDGRAVLDPDAEPAADQTVHARVDPDRIDRSRGEATELERGDRWVVADKPVGMPGELADDDPMLPIYFLADRLGFDRDTFTPVWPLPTTAGGPCLFATTPADATRLRRRWGEGQMMVTWLALVPRPEVPEGTFRTPDGYHLEYAASTMRRGLAELQLTVSREGDRGPDDRDVTGALREQLAAEGIPLLGDRRHGGYMVPGGLRLRLGALFDRDSSLQHSWPAPDDWFPDAPVHPPEAEEQPSSTERLEALDLPVLTLEDRAIDRLRADTHPWIRPTEVADRPNNLRPGTLVRTQGRNEVEGPTALTDSGTDISARVWGRSRIDAAEFEETVRMRTREALARRRELVRNASQTDLFRLVHGEADGLPALAIDRVGPVLRAHVQGPAAYAIREVVYETLQPRDERRLLIEVEPQKSTGRGPRIVHESGEYLSRGRATTVREAGLRYRVDPWEPVLNVDPAYRSLRTLLGDLAGDGERWLVVTPPLMMATVPLVAAGASTVVTTQHPDGPGLSSQLELNGLSCDSVDAPAPERILDRLDADRSFDGVVLDLDAAAGFAGSDPESAAEMLLNRVEGAVDAGGKCAAFIRPTSAEPDPWARLETVVGDLNLDRHSRLTAPDDFPTADEFPEGTPFVGYLLRRRD